MIQYETIYLQIGSTEREIEVQFTYQPEVKPCLTGNPDHQHDGEPEQFDIVSLFDIKTKTVIASDSDRSNFIALVEDEILEMIKEARSQI